MSTTANSAGHRHLSTPTLDTESQSILQSISSHGGYAFARMATLAAVGDQRAAEAAREMAWEQLHSGPWHSVLPIWRDAYAMACLHVAKFNFTGGDFSDALKALDMGLIMGGPLLRNDLHEAVRLVSLEAREVAGNVEHSVCRTLVSDHKLDLDQVRQVLPKRSLSSQIVVKRAALSLEGFLSEYLLSSTPVVITDCMDHWPARMRWNDKDYLKRVAGGRTVPVEVGKNYLCTEWKQELITFSQFLERIQSNDCSSITYLAQHPLFDQINELRNDICIPDYCFAGGGELRSLNSWFGPAGTVTPLHHDPHHNILAQVVGKKYIRLYPAFLSEELYPYSETMLSNSSQVDLDNIDDKEFSRAVDLEFLDCILEEGEMLYIPPKWWHYVRSLTTSLSVSFWWSDDESSSGS